jgi:hypothetical protein
MNLSPDLLWLTSRAVVSGCAAIAHDSLLFTVVFAVATGLGITEILTRVFNTKRYSAQE